MYHLLLGLSALLGACAHNIVITPETKALPPAEGAPIDRKVGYYISGADYDAQVTTPGGGGDKVTYKPLQGARARPTARAVQHLSPGRAR